MKKSFLLLLTIIYSISLFGQLKKDGTPDMRYKANKQIYGNSYSSPSYSTPSYSSPAYSDTYPSKKDGTPDMRFKANKEIYGNSYSNSSVSNYSTPTVDKSIKSYTKNNGSYVSTYYRTRPNITNHDNYSTSGNINPYTGQNGYKAQDRSPEAFNYGAGYEIKTGDRGGQYYINRMGKKTYVPKRY